MASGRQRHAADSPSRWQHRNVQLPRLTKPIAVLLVLVALLLYLLLIDLGVNAGRVHYGVTVGGYDVGGKTFPETVELLDDHGEELQETPIVLGAEGFDCRFTPKEIGWGPQPSDTAEIAMGIGRPISDASSILERIDAWMGGTTVGWADQPDESRVDGLLDRCEEAAGGLSVSLDREGTHALIARAITQWPRPPVIQVPLLDAAR